MKKQIETKLKLSPKKYFSDDIQKDMTNIFSIVEKYQATDLMEKALEEMSRFAARLFAMQANAFLDEPIDRFERKNLEQLAPRAHLFFKVLWEMDKMSNSKK